MRYRSTRGGAEGRGFADVLIEGLAPDGGLYVPDSYPTLGSLPDSYTAAVAASVRPFVEPDPLGERLEEITAAVYAGFRHSEVAPVRDMGGNRHLLELFWGPTLSFKDHALGLLGALFDEVRARDHRRLLILGATSGDTGSAAIEACRGREGIDIVVLYPQHGLTEVQRRQMTTVPDDNVHAVAVAGSFDDCQRMVKEAFATLSGRHPLAAVNSINWARIMAQSAYYAFVSRRFPEPVRFVVPTGNFGNVLSAEVARRMGAPIAHLVVANNANHGLSDLIHTGRLRIGPVLTTVAPAMDIQVPSNLERHLFEIMGGDPARIRELQRDLAETGVIELDGEAKARLQRGLTAAWRPDAEVVATIARTHQETGMVLDPHTAIAWDIANQLEDGTPTVVVATAHPAKFGDVVAAAVGETPELPAEVAAALDRPERSVLIEADMGALAARLDGIAG